MKIYEYNSELNNVDEIVEFKYLFMIKYDLTHEYLGNNIVHLPLQLIITASLIKCLSVIDSTHYIC
jgi:hypothetical protein